MMEKTTKQALINTNYIESLKTAKIQIDPYKQPAEAFSDDRTKWPEISYVDVVHFLILQQSAYTKDQLNNYKSLDAYKLFQTAGSKKYCTRKLMGSIFREKPLEPWVIVATDGSVETAHCTTVTDVPAYWMLSPSPKFETSYKPIKDMDFQSALKKRILSSNESVHSDSEKQAASKISSPTENEVILFWDELHRNLPKAAILSLRGKGKFSENFKPKSLLAEWPIDLSQLCLGTGARRGLDVK
ncbi:hypothetical protein ACJMK2_020699 [Sinanodonta woodiana]|uniref:Uncharacterized protein n=1 Tax=Sinanodonta woodiana TaxID=1069815 RepID=A0ABD3U1B2_SINWO